MAIVVAVRPGRSNAAALAHASELADALDEPVVATAVIVVAPGVPSPLRDGMRDEDYLALIAQDVLGEARAALGPRLARGEAVAGRSVRAGLLAAVERAEATRLVLGSAARGERGRTRVGEVASGLLHTAPVAVHIVPVGHERAFDDAPIRRVTVAFGPGDGSREALACGAVLADGADGMLRAVTFFVREHTGALAGAHGYGAQIAKAWHEQLRESVDAAIRGMSALGLPSRFISTEFGDGANWRSAIDAIEWAPGELLVVGSRSRGPIRSVFLGSRAAEILHHAPVPVAVLPS